MPATKVIKPKPAEATRKTLQKNHPVKVTAVNGAQSALKAPAVRQSRASSCPRCPQRDRCERRDRCPQRDRCERRDRCPQRDRCERRARCPQRDRCERRARSASIAPKTNPDCRKATNAAKPAAVRSQWREKTVCPGQREAKPAGQSHRAFTIIPPDPNRRREIQRKAEAELAALEELRLSRAMAYVSIDPSSVGGCMSLEEVRRRQQQEMMNVKRKQKPLKMQVMQKTPVLSS